MVFFEKNESRKYLCRYPTLSIKHFLIFVHLSMMIHYSMSEPKEFVSSIPYKVLPVHSNYYRYQNSYVLLKENEDRKPTTAIKRNGILASKKTEHEHTMKNKEVEVDSTLDDLLEVMGPHLFLIPFVMKALPFAIPAIPLSYVLSKYEHSPITELLTQLMEYLKQIRELVWTQKGGMVT